MSDDNIIGKTFRIKMGNFKEIPTRYVGRLYIPIEISAMIDSEQSYEGDLLEYGGMHKESGVLFFESELGSHYTWKKL